MNLFSGSTISYGTRLPPPSAVVDGSFFYLSAPYVDSGSLASYGAGLYLFSFVQDTSGAVGDQVGSAWSQITSAGSLGSYLPLGGGSLSGRLTITAPPENALTLSSTAPGIQFIETDQGLNQKQWVLVADGAAFQLQTRDDSFGSATTILQISRAGAGLLAGSTIWTAGNDGAGSGLDADLLDGQQGSFYSNLANSTGVLGVAHGGTGVSVFPAPLSGGIVFGASGTSFGITAAGSTGQILGNVGGVPQWVSACAR